MLAELRIAGRSLRSRPFFTCAAIAILAIGIGSNAAIFSVINAVLLRPLPFPDSRRLASVYTRYLPSTGYDFPYFSLSGPEFADVSSRVDALSSIAAYDFSGRNLTREGVDVERVITMRVTSRFFDVLGVRPAQGRAFTEDEVQRGGTCLAILAYETALSSGTRPGSSVRLDDEPCEVIGVMPQGFAFRDDRVRIWTPLRIDTEENRESHSLLAIARLRDGVTSQQAGAQLQALRAYWAEKYPDHYAKGHFAVTRDLKEDLVGDQRQALTLLGGAVLFVLLIVCVNVAALLVSRGEARRREFAIRHALGANRRRLIRQLLGEALLLAAAGGMVGVLLANWVLAGLLALYPERLPVWQTVTIDLGATLFGFALVVVAGFAIGLVPALHATGARMSETLKADARASTATRRGVLARSALVVGQLALSVILLAGAVLLIRSYQQLQQIDLGIASEGLLTFSLTVPPGHQPDPTAARRLLTSIEDRIASMPGVETAATISNLPVASAGPPDDFVIEGRSVPPAGSPSWNARYLMTTPRMFGALRISLKRGRLLSERDVAGQPLVAVINETAARLYWRDDDPIGRTIRYYPQKTSPSIRIVGVVGDVRSLGPNNPAPPAVYVPFAQAPRPPYEGRTMTFVIRVRGNPNEAVPPVRAAVSALDPTLPLANVRLMSDVTASAMGQPRFTTLVMSIFAGVSFFLAALGLYGILAYTVEQRTREIGVRIALGARNREILHLIVGNGMALTVLGAAIGLPAALALTHSMRDLLTGVASSDPLTYAAVVIVLALAAFLASYLPARRATRIDPIVALRHE